MSGGRQSERLRGKVPVNYSDTRRIDSPNRYSILDPDDDTVEEETIEFMADSTEDWFVIDSTMSDDKKSHKVVGGPKADSRGDDPD